MARLVMKFGGTSVADIDRIRNVARHVKREVDAGHQVAVVVSAMAGNTNQLVAWTRGSRAAARCARIRHGRRRRASRSPPGCWRSRCRTSASTPAPGRAGRSRSGPTARMARRASPTSTATMLIERMEQGQVAVVAGFQGIAPGQPHRDASAAAARIPARWRWPPRSTPTAATSIPTSTASTRPIRASCRRRAA